MSASTYIFVCVNLHNKIYIIYIGTLIYSCCSSLDLTALFVVIALFQHSCLLFSTGLLFAFIESLLYKTLRQISKYRADNTIYNRQPKYIWSDWTKTNTVKSGKVTRWVLRAAKLTKVSIVTTYCIITMLNVGFIFYVLAWLLLISYSQKIHGDFVKVCIILASSCV